MSDPVMIALIVGAQAIAVAWLNSRTKKIEAHVAETKADIAETKTAIVTLEKNTNSIKDELVKVTGLEQRAVGKLEGKAEEKQKQSDREHAEEHSG